MNIKKEIPDIIVNNEKVPVTIALFDGILRIFNDLNFNQTTICEKIGFSKKTCSDILKKRSDNKIKNSIKIFVYKAFVYLTTYESEKYFFNSNTNLFDRVDQVPATEFINGIYYGFFRKAEKSIETNYHFILNFENDVVTIWSKYDNREYTTSTGKLETNEGTYYAILENKVHKKVNFFIGQKDNDPYQKVFIGTWSTKKNEICSALCLVVFIKNSPYNNLDKIIAAKADVHQEILSKRPDDAEDFFTNQEHKFITEKKGW